MFSSIFRIVAMVRREREEEKGERGHRLSCVISVKKLDNCPRRRLVNLPTFRLGVLSPQIREHYQWSYKLQFRMPKANAQRGEEFRERKKKTSSKSSRNSNKQKKLQIHQVLVRNLDQSTHERISSKRKKTWQNSLLMPSIRDVNAI
ncbi:uncharacterized protein TNCV_2890561 [Trichonephila clavipes]|nr:uncharacterized protein TNCV_2890561 [Trichonephila clavipes]